VTDDLFKVNILTEPGQLKRIAITCRCGHRFVTTVPKFLDETCEAIIMLQCTACGQPYGRHQGKLVRLSRVTLLPEKVIADQVTKEDESIASDDVKLDGKTIVPGTDTIQ